MAASIRVLGTKRTGAQWFSVDQDVLRFLSDKLQESKRPDGTIRVTLFTGDRPRLAAKV